MVCRPGAGEHWRCSDAPVEGTKLDRYGFSAVPWSRPRDCPAAGPPQPGTPFFLGTSRPDGRPHAAGIGARWLDGELYFTSRPGTRKSRNLAANLAGTISVRLAGIDLVLAGAATRVADRPTLEQVAALYLQQPGQIAVDPLAHLQPRGAERGERRRGTVGVVSETAPAPGSRRAPAHL